MISITKVLLQSEKIIKIIGLADLTKTKTNTLLTVYDFLKIM